jgi:hypothetical protein
MEDATSRYILNPFDVNCSSMLLVDRAWVIDLNTYRRERQYFIDFGRRPDFMK